MRQKFYATFAHLIPIDPLQACSSRGPGLPLQAYASKGTREKRVCRKKNPETFSPHLSSSAQLRSQHFFFLALPT